MTETLVRERPEATSSGPVKPLNTLVLANAHLVLPDDVLTGSIKFESGKIVDIVPGSSIPPGAIDCEGDYLIPGLVELHTDNLERHLSPRPRVKWPHNAAIMAHDGELASVGITTVFDAVRLGFIHETTKANEGGSYGRSLVNEILSARAAGHLRISHHIHLRAEICSTSLLDELQCFGPKDRVGIVSLMDHTPGQRQFADLAQYEIYMRGKYGYSEDEFAAHVEQRLALGERVRESHESATIEAARCFGAVLASHDDTTMDHVERSAHHGIKLAEFPTTIVAARGCKAHDIDIIMGAPNIVRGGSHSGNVAAHTLAEHDLLDIISSDYVPSALLYSAVKLAEQWDDMPRAIQTVTANPARAVGLIDRGKIEIGLRADLVRLRLAGGLPATRGVWCEGRQVG